jgi:hypothetical protein
MKLTPMAAAVAAIVALCSTAAVAQYAVRYDVIGGGGAASSQGSLWLHDTIGQITVEPSSQPGEWEYPGYWQVIRWLNIGPTSAVTIAAFDARWSNGVITLSWTIVDADGLQGFNVYRATGVDGPLARINDTLIPTGQMGEWQDRRVRPATTYRYRLGAVDTDGEFLSPTVSVVTPAANTELYQNVPNPFNPTTTISFYLPANERVTLVLYDVGGRMVRRLVDGVVGFGQTDVTWDGANDRGEKVGSGVYFYRLTAGRNVITKKLTLLK